MNVFLLDLDPLGSAAAHVDDHVAYVTVASDRPPIRSCKMAIEGCQLMATVHWHGVPRNLPRESWPAPYLPTHERHPWTLAVMSSRHAYELVREHTQALLIEHEHRTGQAMAKVQTALDCLWEPPEWIESRGWRVPVCRAGLPTEYVSNVADAVKLYRAYYTAEKIARMPRFTRRQAPLWMI